MFQKSSRQAQACFTTYIDSCFEKHADKTSPAGLHVILTGRGRGLNRGPPDWCHGQ
ncbi:hypothetical protein LGE20_002797 [Salmonella enterica]|nr:hypothetical protein [Salmonella enterica]EIG9535238.1 hypothetical protein [Salmonella enterica]EIH0807524.1 hypothetical protein [Salmonella enterica]EIH2226240.1 hypothetical protein [Salmonella enterica]EIH3858732.1 hypothetical protein [Salmonella enterica]